MHAVFRLIYRATAAAVLLLVTASSPPLFAQDEPGMQAPANRVYLEHILPKIEQDRRARETEQREMIQTIFIPAGLLLLLLGIWMLLHPQFFIRLMILGNQMEGVKSEITTLTWLGVRINAVVCLLLGLGAILFALL